MINRSIKFIVLSKSNVVRTQLIENDDWFAFLSNPKFFFK